MKKNIKKYNYIKKYWVDKKYNININIIVYKNKKYLKFVFGR